MLKINHCILFILIITCQTIFSQEKSPVTIPDTYIIPFQLTASNNLSIQAILNKKDTVHLMFHTASNSVTLTEDAIKKITSIQFEGTDTVKSWGGAGNTARFSKSNVLQIAGVQWEDIPIWENKNSGPATDGKFGTELFNNKVIAINFVKKTLTISTDLPAKARKYQKLKLTVENDNMFLEANCQTGQGTYANKFLIHSGYAGTVLFDDKFASENHIAQQLKVVDEKTLKDSYGNVLKVKKAILPLLIIGNEKLTDVPVGFFEGAIGRQKMSIFGGDLLKRFNIIIDAQREYIYLQPNQLKRSTYNNS